MVFGKHINKYYVKYGIPLIIGVLILFVVDWYNIQIPKLFGEFIDNFENSLTVPMTHEKLWKFIKDVSYVVLVMLAGRFLWRIFIFGTSRQIQYDLRSQLFDHALKLDQPYYQTHKVGAIMAYFSNDLESIRNSFGPGFLTLFDSLFLGILVLIRMFRMNYQLTLLSTIPLVFLGVAAYFVIKKMRIKFRLRQDSFEGMSDFTQESFSGLSVIKAFVKEVKESYTFAEHNQDFYNKHMDFVKTSIWVSMVINTFVNLTVITLLSVGSYIIIVNPSQLSIGQLTEFFSLFGTLIWPVMALTRFANIRSQASASYSRISNFLDSKPIIIEGENIISKHVTTLVPLNKSDNYNVKEGKTESYKVNFRVSIPKEIKENDASATLIFGHEGFNINKGLILKQNQFEDTIYEGRGIFNLPSPLLVFKIVVTHHDQLLESHEGVIEYPLFQDSYDVCQIEGNIEFKDLNFAYPDAPNQPILKNVNVTINKGERVGILGRTGSGKSTFVDLLLKVYNVDNQSILLDGKDIMQLKTKCVRENIAYVPQDNFLYSTTIKDNIGFSMKEMPMENVEYAAKLSDVYDNIVEFKDGFDTTLGERGITVSGGQKQRISIARALAKDAPILILDDSVSAVDTNTEEAILNNLNTVRKGKTTILIAHRISTVRKLDKIILLDEGKVLDIGSHEELLKRNALYQDMVKRQTLESKVMGDA